MLSIKRLAFIVTTIAPLALTGPVNKTSVQDNDMAEDDYWAQFCDDSNCSEGCGESVRVPNPGCLNEYGRRSILFHGGPSHDYAMVVSPSANCPCQELCAPVPLDTICWNISQYENSQSFRFQSEICGDNGC
ncbi:hypothetical protein F5Y13DRAFT_194819 [Hypoxylon sp. FL1857]|nr:hypothetical protein F5Y13DRAFT_194819 [Hypoxylon sp. FL1857]